MRHKNWTVKMSGSPNCITLGLYILGFFLIIPQEWCCSSSERWVIPRMRLFSWMMDQFFFSGDAVRVNVPLPCPAIRERVKKQLIKCQRHRWNCGRFYVGCVFRLWLSRSVVISGCHYNTFVLAPVNTCPIGETFTYHSAHQHNLP